MLDYFFDQIEYLVRLVVVFLTSFMPVKVIRDDKGIPFLYQYHLFALTNDGPGICIRHFVKSNPNRGYHDHPWGKSLNFILCGSYKECVLNNDKRTCKTYNRNRWTCNLLDGTCVFHHVMIEEDRDAWTFFVFQKRKKKWGIVSLDGKYKEMSSTVSDQDGGWWNHIMKGLRVHFHLKHKKKAIACTNIVIFADNSILLIKRGNHPYKNWWAFPGGRIEQKDINIKSAAYRKLKEETDINMIDMNHAATIGNSTRDPRGFCLTCVFLAKLDKIPKNVNAGDDVVDFRWFKLDKLPEMAFDHKEILENYIICQE